MIRYIDWWAYQTWVRIKAPADPPHVRVAFVKDAIGTTSRPGPWVVQQHRSDDLRWQDPITGTCFCLRADEAAHITEASLPTLAACVSKGPDAVAAYMRGLSATDVFPTESELRQRLLPELPYILTGSEKATQPPKALRLADIAWVRNAYYNALLEGALAETNAGPKRIAALVADLGRYGKGSAVPGRAKEVEADPLFQLANALALSSTSVQIDPTWPVDRPIGVVYGGTVKVKEYLFESAELPAVRGASVLLDIINHERIPNAFRPEFCCQPAAGLIPESLVMAGGGNVFAIVPAKIAAAVARYIEELHERITMVAQSVAVAHCLPAKAFLKGGEDASRAVLTELVTLQKARQGVKLPWWPQEFADPSVETEGIDLNFGAAPDEQVSYPHTRRFNGARVCDRCRQRMAAVEVERPEGLERLCRPCLLRAHAGRELKHRLHRMLRSYAEARNLQISGQEPKTIHDIVNADQSIGGRGGMIAVVYGDGNNMGQVVQRLSSFASLHLFAQRMETTITDAVFSALIHHCGRVEAEFLLLGGDDMFFLMPASRAAAVSCALSEAFDLAFTNLSEGRPTITMSVGLAIGHEKAPIEMLVDAARQLLKSAKAAAKDLPPTDALGTVDFATLESSVSFSDSIKSYRSASYWRAGAAPHEKMHLTLRPYRRDAAQALIKAVHALQDMAPEVGKGLVYRLRSAVLELEPEEANLYCQYELARLGGRRAGALSRLERALADVRRLTVGERAGEPATAAFWRTRTSESCWATPWLDVVDLWDYAEGGFDDDE